MRRLQATLSCALAATVALAACPPVSAQQYPAKPVKIVVPYPPGGPESGLPDYEVVLWTGLGGPRGLPRPIVDRINSEVTMALKLRETGERLQADGSSPAGGTPEQFAAIIKRDIEVWGKAVREAGVKPE